MENEILTYKGAPLVRSGNKIFYGDPKKKYILVLTMMKMDKETGLPGRVNLQIRTTDGNGTVVNEAEKTTLGEAFELGCIWLDHLLAQ